MRWMWFGWALLVAPLAFSAKPAPAPPPVPVAPPAPAAPAAPTAAQVIAYRQAVMRAASGHMAALGLIAKGQSNRIQDAPLHAAALHDLAGTVAALFPEGSGAANGLDTEAKPEIWTEAAKFTAAVQAFEGASGKLVEVSKAGDLAALKAQFGEVGASCGDCHDGFKIDEDHR